MTQRVTSLWMGVPRDPTSLDTLMWSVIPAIRRT